MTDQLMQLKGGAIVLAWTACALIMQRLGYRGWAGWFFTVAAFTSIFWVATS